MNYKPLYLVVFLMMIFIFINELKNISVFIFKYNSIKDIAKINTEQMCNNLYCEAETGRFQLAKNVYNLALPNDIYNAKTYTIFVLIYAIILFIYAFHLFMSFLKEDKKNFKYSKYFISFIILYLLICFIMIIVMRYVPYDEKGYLNYFKKENNYGLSADAFNSLIFTILIILLLVFFIIFNRDRTFDNIPMVIFISLYFIFALYFLFNMINIVAAFKDNKHPYEKEKNSHFVKDENYTVDISYASENIYYDKYFDMKDIPNSIFTVHNGFFYNIHEIYMKNFIIHAIALFILFSLIALGYIIYKKINDKNDKNDNILENYLSPLTPFFILLILLIYILNFTSFNTAFNKLVLYGATSSSYKRNLNQLNNVVTPFIKMGKEENKHINYLYHCVILNVFMSYLHNYINIVSNQKKDGGDLPLNFSLDFKNFKKVNIVDKTSFHNYYKTCADNFKSYLEYVPGITEQSQKNNIVNKLKLITDKIDYNTKETLYNNIKNSIYYFIDLINNSDLQSQEFKDKLSGLAFYKDSSSSFDIYKFINYKKDISDIDDNKIKNVVKIDVIDNIIKTFIDSLISIKLDTPTTDTSTTDTSVSATNYTNIETSIEYITSDSELDDKEIVYTNGNICKYFYNTKLDCEKNKTFILKSLYKTMINSDIIIEKRKNNFVNYIENMYNKINDKNTYLKLYQNQDINEQHNINGKEIKYDYKQITEASYDYVKDKYDIDIPYNKNINIVDTILHKANSVAREKFITTYIFNIVIIIVFYFHCIKNH